MPDVSILSLAASPSLPGWSRGRRGASC